jgi:hypothetical protein
VNVDFKETTFDDSSWLVVARRLVPGDRIIYELKSHLIVAAVPCPHSIMKLVLLSDTGELDTNVCVYEGRMFERLFPT